MARPRSGCFDRRNGDGREVVFINADRGPREGGAVQPDRDQADRDRERSLPIWQLTLYRYIFVSISSLCVPSHGLRYLPQYLPENWLLRGQNTRNELQAAQS